MTLDQILNDKGRSVATIASTATLQSAAKLLDEKRIGAVVAVQSDGRLAGVLSERDITRHVARKGAAALDMAVGEAMTRDVITAAPGDTVDAALGRMTDRRIRHLPVSDDGEGLTGLVSIGDLVKWKIAEAEAEADAMKSYLTAG
ncbi:MAG: CBS domain-containing protein [Pseudomonadota bacterium]